MSFICIWATLNHPFNNHRSHYLYVQSAALQLCQGKLLFYAASHLEKNVRYPFYLADTIFYSFLYFVHHDSIFQTSYKVRCGLCISWFTIFSSSLIFLYYPMCIFSFLKMDVERKIMLTGIASTLVIALIIFFIPSF